MRPTLIIGLGGAGMRVTTGIYEKFLEHNPTQEERGKLICLCFDTDRIDIQETRGKLPSEWVVDIAPDLPIQPVFDLLKSGSSVQNWFDDDVLPLTHVNLHKGTAMFRQTARLALLDADSKEKLTVINQSIAHLSYLAQYGPDVDIRIICSLAGGTGSGIFLQIAYYVKEVMRNYHINNPGITGYFLLADVFRDVVYLYEVMTRMQANTYASLKELNAFNRQNGANRLPIEFEYRYGQSDKTLPPYPPYDLCYLMGANASPNYLSRLSEFVLDTVLSPVGGHFQAQIPPRMVGIPPYRRYASLGIAKMVYPIDDMVHYFALRYASEKMTNWLRIDTDFQAAYKEYKKKLWEGPVQKPEKGVHYKDQVKNLAYNLQGRFGAEFHNIFRSTQILDSNRIPTGTSKAQTYLEKIKNFVTKTVNSNPKLKELYEECTKTDINFTIEDDPENDFQFVAVREHFLNEYEKMAECFINTMKRVVPKQCFLDDFENENYVSKTPDQDQHHLNTFLLPKDEELHPVAVRYLLYDLQIRIETDLFALKYPNEKLWETIACYSTLFDNPETEPIENPLDFIESAKQRDRKILNRITGKRPYKEAKIEYETASRQQAENIHDYTINKLLEETLSSLRDNISRLIEESESFFNQLSDVLKDIDQKCEYFLHKHEGGKEKDITYILASAQNKEDIYNHVILEISPFFPSVLSAEIYRSMYKNVCKELEATKIDIDMDAKREAAIEAKREAAIEANQKIITKYVAYLDKKIRKEIDDDHFATKNVMEALREEAMRKCNDHMGKAMEYMEQQLHTVREQAHLWGPTALEDGVRYFNAWCLNSNCVNPVISAAQLTSEFFSPFEIVRINQAYGARTSDWLSDLHRNAYEHIVEKYQFSIHLDKRWNSLLPEPEIRHSELPL